MKHLNTEILINANAADVWNVLMDIEAFPNWNPFIIFVDKKFKEGEKIKIILQQPGSKPMTIKPVVIKVVENKELRWLGHLGFPGLFDGQHIFELKSLEDGSTKFLQREEFKGILVNLFWKQLNTKTRKGFEMMNQKLKELAEAQD